MNTIKSLLSAALIFASGALIAQTSEVSFANLNDVWKQEGNVFKSEFSFSANAANLSVIKERYDNLGQNVSYAITNSNGNSHTIVMTFSGEVHKSYMYKTLLFIEVEKVFVGEEEMSLENFSSFLND